MDWSRIPGNLPEHQGTPGVYVSLDDLVRIRFRARDFAFLPRQPVNSILSGRYASRLRGRGLNFEELRHYQTGDDTRNMDWRVTARTRSPHVRVYTEEKDRSVLILADQRMNMFFGSRHNMKSVTAAELLALSVWRALDVGDRVGALIFNDAECLEIRPQHSQKGAMSILEAMVRMNHQLCVRAEITPNTSMLNEALHKAVRFATHDALVIIISDFFGVDEHTKKLTARLATHNDVLGILVHDPMRIQPPAGTINVSDGKLQMQLDLSRKEQRERLARDYLDEQEQIRDALHKLSAPLLIVNNEDDAVQQIRRLLGIPPVQI